MQLPGTMGTPVFGGADVTKFIEAYKSLSSRTGTDSAAEDVIATFPYYCSETFQDTMKMMNGYPRKDWVQLKEELKDSFRHTDSRVYMYVRSYLGRLCSDQLERGHIRLKTCILAYDNISRIMINKGALAEYSQVEMLLGAFPRELRAKAVMELDLDPRDPWTFKYDKLRKHVLDECGTADTLTLLNSEGARTAPGVSPYSILAGVPLPQMPVGANHPAIPNEETPAPAQAMEEIRIAKAENTIDMKIDTMMKAFKAWTFQLSKANEPRHRGYQTARAYAIQADHPPTHTPMNFTPPNAPTGPAYYQPGPNYQQYPRQASGPFVYCDEQEHIRTFCPDVRTDQEKGIVHLNDRGRLTSGPRGGNGGEISWYRPERTFLSMREYAWEVAPQGQQGGGVATTAAPQPPQPQQVARSQLFQRASAQVTAFPSGIAQPLSEIDGY